MQVCWQEENKILDKMHRSKVNEVEKLSSTIRDLEEAVLAGGAAVNAARDFQRQVQELMVRKRTHSFFLGATELHFSELVIL